MTIDREGKGSHGRSSLSRMRSSPKALRKSRRRRIFSVLVSIGVLVLTLVAAAAWLGFKAIEIKSELTAATSLVPSLRAQIAADDARAATDTVAEIRNHSSSARIAADDPLWSLASALPGPGANFSAIAEVARSADDVAALALAPLVQVYDSVDWETLLPSNSGTALDPLEAASPKISAAAHAVRLSAERLQGIDASRLLPEVAVPFTDARDELQTLNGPLTAAADAAAVVPAMLGTENPRNYLLMIQNNAEIRASGGIPGALAILTFDKGKLTLGAQSNATAVGAMSPIVAADLEQQQIYSPRIGRYMHDVNLTPDFPTAASTAQAMWERKSGQRVDGVLSVDPVALGYLLEATGPVAITDPGLAAMAASYELPAELTGENVVQTLLSDVYQQLEQPALQDAYYAGVAQQIFAALSSGAGDAKGTVEGLARGSFEGRVLAWSALPAEQSIIGKYNLSGSISGPSVGPAQFGVYFNDGTGAKMDFYVQREVQLIQECVAASGYSAVTVRVKSTNTAPLDAATSLPAYVTGGAAVGIAPGTVQTNVVAYGPAQAHLAGAKMNAREVPVSSNRHDGRPVGTTTVTLAPGETSSVDLRFNKIVQNSPLDLRVTPTVQSPNDVILDTALAKCPAG